MQELVVWLSSISGALLMMHCVDTASSCGNNSRNGKRKTALVIVLSGVLFALILLCIIALRDGMRHGKIGALALAFIGVAVFSARIYGISRGQVHFRRVSSIAILSLMLAVSSFLLVVGLVYLNTQ